MANLGNIGFFGMLNQAYNSIGLLASAVGRGAQALHNLAAWGEEKTAAFLEKERIERSLELDQFRKRRQELGLDVTDVQVKSTSSTTVPAVTQQ